jgi:hypothetical protein
MSTLRAWLAERVSVADGAFGAKLQVSEAARDDFAGHESRAGIPGMNRLDILAGTYGTCLEADTECVPAEGVPARWVPAERVPARSGQL